MISLRGFAWREDRKEWYDGIHQALISDELFEQCQAVRRSMVTHRKPTNRRRTYVLHDRVYCATCAANKPTGLVDDKYGKMRPFWHKENTRAYYRCLAKDRGYEPCGQGFMPVDELDDQVVAALCNLTVPEGFQERVEEAVRSRVENETALQRMEEVREVIERVDFRWDHGFIPADEYLEKRQQLERELEALRPIEHDELIEAADLIQNFKTYWQQCDTTEKPDDARKQLLAKIVERVFVDNGQVLAVVVHGDFGVVLGENEKASAEIADALEVMLTNEDVSMSRSQCGSDGLLSICRYQTPLFYLGARCRLAA